MKISEVREKARKLGPVRIEDPCGCRQDSMPAADNFQIVPRNRALDRVPTNSPRPLLYGEHQLSRDRNSTTYARVNNLWWCECDAWQSKDSLYCMFCKRERPEWIVIEPKIPPFMGMKPTPDAHLGGVEGE